MTDVLAPTRPVIEDQLRSRLDYFEAKFREDQLAELVENFYTEDAVVEGPGFPQQIGRDALKSIFSEVRKSYRAIEIAMDPIVHPGSDLVYAFITNRNIRIDENVEIHRAAIVWRLIDGQWYCQTDFFFTM